MDRDAALALTGRRVIITRSVADNRSLREALIALGAEVIEVPLIEVLPPADGGAALRDAVDRLEDFDWVVLTSVNALHALARARSSEDVEPRWPVGLRAAVVGPATAAAATAAGLTVVVEPPVATAAGLVEAFPSSSLAESEPGGDRVLAPLAELAGPTVVDGLTAKGYRVDRVTAYRTDVPSDPDPSLDGAPSNDQVFGADAVAFFSPSAVDRFVDRFGERPELAVCIGPSTAARARDRGFAMVETPDEHAERAVVQLIADRLGPEAG